MKLILVTALLVLTVDVTSGVNGHDGLFALKWLLGLAILWALCGERPRTGDDER